MNLEHDMFNKTLFSLSLSLHSPWSHSQRFCVVATFSTTRKIKTLHFFYKSHILISWLSFTFLVYSFLWMLSLLLDSLTIVPCIQKSIHLWEHQHSDFLEFGQWIKCPWFATHVTWTVFVCVCVLTLSELKCLFKQLIPFPRWNLNRFGIEF